MLGFRFVSAARFGALAWARLARNVSTGYLAVSSVCPFYALARGRLRGIGVNNVRSLPFLSMSWHLQLELARLDRSKQSVLLLRVRSEPIC